MSELSGPVLIGYDGSTDARTAVEYAGTLLEGREAVVLTVWEPLLLHVRSAGVLAGFVPPTAMDIDADSEAAARQLAEEGAVLAGLAGIIATPRWEQEVPTVASTIDNVARELDASLVVTGSRGLSRLKALTLGSVSDQLLHNAHRPILVVPSAPDHTDVTGGSSGTENTNGPPAPE